MAEEFGVYGQFGLSGSLEDRWPRGIVNSNVLASPSTVFKNSNSRVCFAFESFFLVSGLLYLPVSLCVHVTHLDCPAQRCDAPMHTREHP